MRFLAVFLMVSVLAAQDSPDQGEYRHDKYASDPHARCMRPEVVEFYGPDNPSLHACSCHQTCVAPQADEEFEPYVREDQACELYCTKARCACHPDESVCPIEVKKK